MLPSVSVIIPCFNRASLVGETIESMLGQTLRPHEVIVVDDGSEDDSVRVVRSFGEKVKLIEQPNRGPGAARNAGFRASSGTLVQFMDSDDIATPNKLEVHARALVDASADMTYGPWIQMAFERREVTALGHVLQSQPVPDSRPLHEWHLRGWALVLQNCLFTREFLMRVGSMHEDLLGTEDTEFMNRVFLSGPRVAFAPSCLVLYRLHDTNKLTAGGTSFAQKSEHLGRAWMYMAQNIERYAPSMAKSTRFLFAYSAWRWRSQLEESGEVSAEQNRIRERLFEITRGIPNACFVAYKLWSRIRAGAARRLTGNPWAKPYHARRAGQPELDLIRAAGYRISPHALAFQPNTF